MAQAAPRASTGQHLILDEAFEDPLNVDYHPQHGQLTSEITQVRIFKAPFRRIIPQRSPDSGLDFRLSRRGRSEGWTCRARDHAAPLRHYRETG
jgi:hypothetical protein